MARAIPVGTAAIGKRVKPGVEKSPPAEHGIDGQQTKRVPGRPDSIGGLWSELAQSCYSPRLCWGGYRKGAYHCEAFCDIPDLFLTCPIVDSEIARTEISSATCASNIGKLSHASLSSVGQLANKILYHMLTSVEVPTRALVTRNGTQRLVANVAGLPVRKRALLMSLLSEFDKIFTDQL